MPVARTRSLQSQSIAPYTSTKRMNFLSSHSIVSLDSHRDVQSPPSSTGETTGPISSFSDNDEDWEDAAGSKGALAEILNDMTGNEDECDVEDPVQDLADERKGDEPSQATFVASVEILVPHVPLVVQTSLQEQAAQLQQHLVTFSQAISGALNLPGQPITMANDDVRISFFERELARLRNLNNALQESNLRLRTQNSALQVNLDRREEETSMDPQHNETSRTNIGIDPNQIQDLAIDLSTGVRTSNDIADALFGLVDSAIPYPSAPEEVHRESLAPRERLRNLEGVLDVSLGRMESLEERVNMLVHPDWTRNRPNDGPSSSDSAPIQSTVLDGSVSGIGQDGGKALPPLRKVDPIALFGTAMYGNDADEDEDEDNESIDDSGRGGIKFLSDW